MEWCQVHGVTLLAMSIPNVCATGYYAAISVLENAVDDEPA